MSKINRPAAPDIAKGEGEQAAMSLKMSRLNFDTLIIQYNAAIRKVNQIPLCTPILTFGQTPQKRPILAPKKEKNGPKKERHFPNPYWRGLFAKNRTQIAQNLPLWRHLHFTPAYMGSPPCTLSHHPNIKETGYSNVLRMGAPLGKPQILEWLHT